MGITKKGATNLARHTLGTVVTISNGVITNRSVRS
jgi:hypothetical protein